MADRRILYKLLPLLVGGKVADAADIELDDSALDRVTAEDVQDLASVVNDLSLTVASLSRGQPARVSGPFVPFTDSINIGPSNYAAYSGNIALYARSTNARVNFILPTDAEITAEGVPTDEAVEFTVLNQAGTARFDTGFTPTNTVIIDVEGANNIRRGSETGTLLNFIEAHQNDLVTLQQAERGRPWVATRVTLSSAALLLPSGLFRLRVGQLISANPVLPFLAGFNAGETPVAGDAYQISVANPNFGGFGIEAGDVIVALQDSPSLLNNSSNDDWVVIRNATNDIISLSEIHFLNTVSETVTHSDQRLEERSDVNDARVWLSPYVLEAAPFLTPSTDPNNPPADEEGEYIGGDELDLNGSNGYEFRATPSQLGPFVDESVANTIHALVYVRITGSIAQSDLDNSYLVHKDADGTEIERFSLDTDFRSISLPSSGTSLTYLVFDDVGATDNFSSINYHAGQTLELVLQVANRSFTLSDAVNILASIADGSIELDKLNPTVQALIRDTRGISAVQEAKIAGLTDTTTSSPIPDQTDLYVKLDEASSTNDLSHYVNVRQLNGIVPNYERTRSVFFLAPTNINVTQLQKVESTSTKLAVTVVGEISTANDQKWIAYRATLPAITGDNSPLDNAWQLDGTLQTTELSGAEDSFKVRRANLADTLTNWIQSLIPSGNEPTPFVLPDNLQALNRALTVTTTTSTGWSAVLPHPYRSSLVREYAAFWDENRTSATTAQIFSDLTGTEVVGFTANHKFFYTDPNDRYNTSFPGAGSYYLNDAYRFRNASGQTTIANNLRKIVGFDYALQISLSDGADLSMVRLGGTSNTPLMGLHHEEGLYLNIGRGDGGQQSRTYSEILQVDGGHWHDQVDQVISAEAEIIIPQSKSGSLTVQIDIQLDDNGNDEGTHEETITITNVGADQNLGQRTFDFAGFPSVTCNITYEHDNNDLSRSRRVIFLRPTQPFTNAALTYNVAAYDRITETWNHPTTYARFPINAGDSHDDYGLFDPSLWNTEHVLERNRVLFQLQPYRLDDSESDPEIAVLVIVDGEVENSGNPIRLHRPASDFGFTDVRIGNNECAVAHIQMYAYSGDPLTHTELLYGYNHANQWLGAFYPPGHAAETIAVNANWEIGAGYGLIMTDVDTSTRRIVEVASGALTNKDA